MRRPLAVLMVVLAFAAPGAFAEPKPVRTGWNALSGPYGCLYLEVTGPQAARAAMLKRAKEQYREPDPEALAAVADRVVIRASATGTRRCAGMVPQELIFVDKKDDSPALRVPLAPSTAVLQNGFGSTWTSSDGLATMPLADFQSALGSSKYKVVVVLASGATEEIKSGIGQSTWSGDHTRKVE